MDAYFAACPAPLEHRALSLLSSIGTPESIARESAALRKRIIAESDLERLRAWEDVWTLEFKARPAAEHEAVRKQIAADIKRLELIPAPKDDDRWASTLGMGYRMVGDPSTLRQGEDRFVAAFPDSDIARVIVEQRWRKEHPYPAPDATEERKQAYYRAQLSFAEEQLKRAPTQFEYLMQRFYALSELESSTGEQVAAAGKAMLDSLRNGAGIYAIPPFQFAVARALLKKQVEVPRVPELIAEGLKNFRERVLEQKDDSDAGESRSEFFVNTDGAGMLIDAARQFKKPEIAARAVAEIEAMQATKASSRSTVLELRARFAEVEGRKLDALLLYRAAMEARPADVKPKKDELVGNIARLWKELGGTAATRDLWERKDRKFEVAQGEGRWETPKKPMPPWELSDLAGKIWKLSSLEGKTVLINVWSTGCGPCRAEHPYFEKLYAKLRGRADVQLLSFNIDDEVGLVAPYMKEKGYTFPVLLASSYVNDLPPSVSIPRNWIVDAAGKWRLEQIGFGNDANWEQDMIEKIDRTKPEPAPQAAQK